MTWIDHKLIMTRERSEKKNWGHFSMTQHGKKKLFFFPTEEKNLPRKKKTVFFFPTEEKDFSVKTAVPGLRGRCLRRKLFLAKIFRRKKKIFRGKKSQWFFSGGKVSSTSPPKNFFPTSPVIDHKLIFSRQIIERRQRENCLAAPKQRAKFSIRAAAATGGLQLSLCGDQMATKRFPRGVKNSKWAKREQWRAHRMQRIISRSVAQSY